MSLEASGLHKRYAGLVALDSVSLVVEPGQIVALIGPNGAGKTTCFDVISGAQRADGGEVHLDGEDLTSLPPWRRCGLGLARTFQIVRPLARLTVGDNVKVGAYLRSHASADADRVARDALERVGLASRYAQPAGELTLLQQKQLEIARALATQPKYLLLDECFAGLRAGEQDVSMRLVRELADSGLGVLLIEHSMRIVMQLADRIVVLHYGKRLTEGLPAEIAANPDVQTAYLGARHAGG